MINVSPKDRLLRRDLLAARRAGGLLKSGDVRLDARTDTPASTTRAALLHRRRDPGAAHPSASDGGAERLLYGHMQEAERLEFVGPGDPSWRR
jgi:hypothetical protein